MPQELVIDLTEAASFEPITPGWYGATLTEAKPGQSQKGNSKVSIVLEITSGEDPSAIGRKVFDDLVLEGKGTWKMKQLLVAIFGEAEEQVRVSTGDLIGAEVEIRTTNKVWKEEDGGDGEKRSRISRYRQCSLSEQPAGESLATMFE